MSKGKPLIEIRTGSNSDIPKIRGVYQFLDFVGIPYSSRILSAHRTPHRMFEEARDLVDKGFYVSIAAAGGSAHLPGMTASETLLPVVGLPVRTINLHGQDSLYSIIQMPDGIPVGCVGIGQAESAAILASQIAYHNNSEVRNKIRSQRGLEGELSSTVPNNRLIGIIKPIGIDLPQENYEAFLGLIDELGLEREEYDLSVVDFNGAKLLSRELELKGVNSVIAIGALNDEDTTNYFPRFIAENTDVPTIGLPIARGYAGMNQYIEGDIFYSMLCEHPSEEEAVGFPVAGMGINRFKNAALYSAQIVGLRYPDVQAKVQKHRESLAEAVKQKDKRLQTEGIDPFLTLKSISSN